MPREKLSHIQSSGIGEIICKDGDRGTKGQRGQGINGLGGSGDGDLGGRGLTGKSSGVSGVGGVGRGRSISSPAQGLKPHFFLLRIGMAEAMP